MKQDIFCLFVDHLAQILKEEDLVSLIQSNLRQEASGEGCTLFHDREEAFRRVNVPAVCFETNNIVRMATLLMLASVHLFSYVHLSY